MIILFIFLHCRLVTLVWPESTAPLWSLTPLSWWLCGTDRQTCCWEPRWESKCALPYSNHGTQVRYLTEAANIKEMNDCCMQRYIYFKTTTSVKHWACKIPNTTSCCWSCTVQDLCNQTAKAQQTIKEHPFSHMRQAGADLCQADCLVDSAAGYRCVFSSLHRSTLQLWTCGQWAAYLASSSPRNLFSLENLKLTKLTRFSRWMSSFALKKWPEVLPLVVNLLFTVCKFSIASARVFIVQFCSSSLVGAIGGLLMKS